MILGVTVVLTLSGLIAVFSASGYVANVRFEAPTTYFLQRQGIWLSIGFLCMFAVARLDYTELRPYIPHLLGVCVILLVLVLIAGTDSNGARRWFNVRWFSVQPGELAKLVVVLYLASYLGRPDLRVESWNGGFLPPLIVVGFVCALLVVEDFGTPAVLGLILLGMLFLAGARIVHLLGIVVLAVPAGIALISKSRERLERITSFLHPEEDPQGRRSSVTPVGPGTEEWWDFRSGFGAGKSETDVPARRTHGLCACFDWRRTRLCRNDVPARTLSGSSL